MFSTFCCYYTNAQSIRNKILELQDIVLSYSPKIIGLTETWITDDMFDGEFYLDEYILFSCNRMHGGAALFVHNSLNPIQCDELNNFDFCDATWCSVTVDTNVTCLIGVVYRSPNSNEENNNKLLSLLEKVSSSSFTNLLIMGDFNLPLIDYSDMTVNASEESFSMKFFDATQDVSVSAHKF